MSENRFDIEDRLIDSSVRVIRVTEALPNTVAGNHIQKQLIRSGTSPAANYGEAQSAESKADFIHKMKISLKELRESRVWLKIIDRAELLSSESLVAILDESNQLISIFVTSIGTAKTNLQAEKAGM